MFGGWAAYGLGEYKILFLIQKVMVAFYVLVGLITMITQDASFQA